MCRGLWSSLGSNRDRCISRRRRHTHGRDLTQERQARTPLKNTESRTQPRRKEGARRQTATDKNHGRQAHKKSRNKGGSSQRSLSLSSYTHTRARLQPTTRVRRQQHTFDHTTAPPPPSLPPSAQGKSSRAPKITMLVASKIARGRHSIFDSQVSLVQKTQ